jgi:phosphohistidine phosphatase SixA
MTLLIRHARAGKPDEWSGDDRRRPVDERGRGQAADLVEALSDYPLCGHGGLSDVLAGTSQKKGETLVLDGHGRIVERIRP